jgi:hypothetical protein
MVAIFRQFVVLLLVLLQNVAPLVHAHVGGLPQETGLHLSEFENLRFSSGSSLKSYKSGAFLCESAIVSMGSAIKHRQSTIQSLPLICILPSNLIGSDPQNLQGLKLRLFLTGIIAPQNQFTPYIARSPPNFTGFGLTGSFLRFFLV